MEEHQTSDEILMNFLVIFQYLQRNMKDQIRKTKESCKNCLTEKTRYSCFKIKVLRICFSQTLSLKTRSNFQLQYQLSWINIPSPLTQLQMYKMRLYLQLIKCKAYLLSQLGKSSSFRTIFRRMLKVKLQNKLECTDLQRRVT